MALSGNSGNPQQRSPFRFFALLPVIDRASAQWAAKAGAIAGFMVAGANALGFIALMMGYAPLRVPPGHDPHLAALGLEGIFCPLAVVTAFLSWRVLTGRGYISATVLALLVALELAFLFLIHLRGVFVGFILLKFVIDGLRGTWWWRRHRLAVDPEVFG